MRRPSVRYPYGVGLGASADLTKFGLSVDFGDHDSNQFQWSKVNITAGTKVLISVLDDKDQEGWSGVVSFDFIFLYRFIGSLSLPPDYRRTEQRSVLLDLPKQHSRLFVSVSPPRFFFVLTRPLRPSPKPSTTTSDSPDPTIVGAANSGIISGGASTIHLSGVAVAFTALGALVALL